MKGLVLTSLFIFSTLQLSLSRPDSFGDQTLNFWRIDEKDFPGVFNRKESSAILSGTHLPPEMPRQAFLQM
jgi:hypothetical protein